MTDRLGWMGHDGRLELGAMCERGRLEKGWKSLGGPQQGSRKTLSIIFSYFIRLVALAFCEYAERKMGNHERTTFVQPFHTSMALILYVHSLMQMS